MKFTKVMAGILSAALLLTGCSDEGSSTADSSKAETTTTTTAETTTTTEVTTTTAETTTTTAETTTTTEETDAGSSEGDMKPEEPTDAAELAEVQAAIDGYLQANKDKDYAAMIKYYDVGLLYYMETGKEATDAELMQYLQDSEAEQAGSVFGDFTTSTIGEPQCCNSMAQDYNEFLASDMMSQGETEDGETFELDMAGKFKIEGVYVFNVAASESGMDISIDYTVLKINGNWQVDIGLSMVYAFAEMLEGLE